MTPPTRAAPSAAATAGGSAAAGSARIPNNLLVELDRLLTSTSMEPLARAGPSAGSPRIPDVLLLALARMSTSDSMAPLAPAGPSAASARIPDELLPVVGRVSTSTLMARGAGPSAASARIPDELLLTVGPISSSNFMAQLASSGPSVAATDSADSACFADDLPVALGFMSTGSPTRSCTTATSTAAATASATILDLPEHVLMEIFVRLPDRPSIFSASFVCLSWRRCVISPVYRSLLVDFFAFHPPPLLGFYFELGPPNHLGFAPVVPFDPILSDALDRGDFLLDNVPRPREGSNTARWEVKDSQEGYLLLKWSDTGDLAVYKPQSFSTIFIEPPPFVRRNGSYDLHLVVSVDGPVRVICVYHTHGSLVDISAFEILDMTGWERIGSVETAKPWSRREMCAVQAEGKLFWPYLDREKMREFDLFTFDLVRINIPSHSMDFVVGFTEDMEMCLVSAVASSISIWVDVGGDNEDPWLLETFPISCQFATLYGSALETHSDLNVISMYYGSVYLCALQYLDSPEVPWVFFSLCMCTGEVQMLFQTDKFADRVHPMHLPMISQRDA